MSYCHRCMSQKQEEIMALTDKAMLEEALVILAKKPNQTNNKKKAKTQKYQHQKPVYFH